MPWPSSRARSVLRNAVRLRFECAAWPRPAMAEPDRDGPNLALGPKIQKKKREIGLRGKKKTGRTRTDAQMHGRAGWGPHQPVVGSCGHGPAVIEERYRWKKERKKDASSCGGRGEAGAGWGEG